MAAMAPTPAASWPMYRWQNPPIFFRPYICAAFSSNRRIRSIFLRRSASNCASRRSFFPMAMLRAPLSETDDVFSALHWQVPDGLFGDCLQHHEVARVVRELPECLQARSQDLKDLRTERGVFHDVEQAADADHLVQRRRLEHPLHTRVGAHLD